MTSEGFSSTYAIADTKFLPYRVHQPAEGLAQPQVQELQSRAVFRPALADA